MFGFWLQSMLFRELYFLNTFVFFIKGTRDNFAILHGIVIAGSCGNPGGPSIYVRVSNYIKWIKKQMEGTIPQNAECSLNKIEITFNRTFAG